MVAALGVLPSSAVAASVTNSTGVLVFRAAPGELNDLSITRDQSSLWPGLYRITDRGARIEVGGSCITLDAQQVLCPAVWARVALGDGDDRVAATVESGGLPGRMLILGEEGGDSVQLAASPDGPGVRGDAGAAFVRQGRFRDSYSVDTGPGDDLVSGSDEEDVLVGGPGADLLAGGAGDDLIAGGLGSDSLRGDGGGDLLLGGDLEAFERGRVEPQELDVLQGDAGPDLLVGGPGPDRLGGGSGNDALFYDRPRGDLSVTFDGRADDGPAGEGDNVSADIEGAILAASGRLAISGGLRFGDGSYTLAGGRDTRGTVVLLSSQGTGGKALEGRFSEGSFSVRFVGPRGSLARIEARGGRRCGGGASTQSAFSSPRAHSSYKSLRRILAKIVGPRGRRRHGRAAAGPDRAFRVFGRASAATAAGEATWLTTDTCRDTLTQVKTGRVVVKRVTSSGLSRRVLRRLRGTGRFGRGRHSAATVRG